MPDAGFWLLVAGRHCHTDTECDASNGVDAVVKFGYFIVGLLLTGGVCSARTITRDEALKQAFPGAQIQSEMIFLTEQQMKEASEKAGSAVPSALVATYTAVSNGTPVGRAYLDTHIVRTKKESVLIILNADGSIKRTEVVGFEEPPEYQPTEKWYDQFQGRKLGLDLSLKGEIHPVTGASLTARATVDAVRRALAIDQIVQKRQAGKSQ